MNELINKWHKISPGLFVIMIAECGVLVHIGVFLVILIIYSLEYTHKNPAFPQVPRLVRGQRVGDTFRTLYTMVSYVSIYTTGFVPLIKFVLVQLVRDTKINHLWHFMKRRQTARFEKGRTTCKNLLISIYLSTER